MAHNTSDVENKMTVLNVKKKKDTVKGNERMI